MHFLIGFCILIGLVNFAFGERTAQNAVRVLLVTAMGLVFVFAIYLVADVRSTPTESAKIPEDTPFSYLPKVPEDTQELRRMCVEWIAHPNDAPRMCFIVLEKCLSLTDGICGHMPLAGVTPLQLIETYEEFCEKHKKDANYVVCK